MCLAVPFKIESVNGNEAVADRAGVSRAIRVDFIRDPNPGDYVLVHAGFAIEKIAKEQAETNIQAAEELTAQLAEIASEIRKKQETDTAL